MSYTTEEIAPGGRGKTQRGVSAIQQGKTPNSVRGTSKYALCKCWILAKHETRLFKTLLALSPPLPPQHTHSFLPPIPVTDACIPLATGHNSEFFSGDVDVDSGQCHILLLQLVFGLVHSYNRPVSVSAKAHHLTEYNKSVSANLNRALRVFAPMLKNCPKSASLQILRGCPCKASPRLQLRYHLKYSTGPSIRH